MRRWWWTGWVVWVLFGLAAWYLGSSIGDRFRSLERRLSHIERQIPGRSAR